MFHKYWLLRHVNDVYWYPNKVLTLFGTPLCTCFFSVCGPFKTFEQACYYAEKMNREYDESVD